MGYGSSIAVLAAGSILTIPALISAGGPRAWASVAVGQSLGAIAAMVINYGWAVTGPSQIAVASEGTARTKYFESLLARLVIGFPITLVGALGIEFAAGTYSAEMAMGFAGASLIGLNANWYLVGRRRPGALFAWDTLPRALGLFGSAAAAYLTSNILTALLFQIVGVLGSIAVPAVVLGVTRGPDPRGSEISVLNCLRTGFRPMTVNASTTVFSALPIIVVGAFLPKSLPTYAIADKLYRQLSVGLTPFVNVLQGFVPSISRNEAISRSSTGLRVCLVFGVLATLVLAVAGPTIVEVLGISVGRLVCVLMGILVALTFLQMTFQLAVLPALGAPASPGSPILGGIAGLLLLYPLGLAFGAAGALSAVAAGLTFSLVLLARRYRQLRRCSEGGDHGSREI